MFEVITIGAATRDVFLQSQSFKFIKSRKFQSGVGECLSLGSKNEVGKIFFSTGGGATNAAVTFANLGLKIGVVTRIGNDEAGREIIKVLSKVRVNTNFVQHDKTYYTDYSTLLMHGPGERTILVYRGASKKLSFWQKFSLAKSQWLYITSLGGRLDLIHQIWKFAKRHGIKIAWNPGSEELKFGLVKLTPFIKQCEVFNVNREEAARLTACEPQDEACFLGKLQNLSAITLVTDGKHGAYAFVNTHQFFVSSLGTKPRNTTGAGDAFGSGFVAGLILANTEPEARVASVAALRVRKVKVNLENQINFALRLAILNADSVIRHMGAKAGILKKMPSKREFCKIKIMVS